MDANSIIDKFAGHTKWIEEFGLDIGPRIVASKLTSMVVCFSFYVSRFLILVSTSDERAKKDNKREKKSPKKWEFCHVQQLLRNVYVNSRAISIRRHYKAGY